MTATQTQELPRVRHIPDAALETMKLAERLRVGKPGDEATDQELTMLIGKSTAVGGEGYGYLSSAIKHVEREHGIVWRRVRKEDKIRCLNASECVDTAGWHRRCIGRAAKRAGKLVSIAASRGDELPEAERPTARALAAQLGAIHMFAKPNTTRKIIASGAAYKPTVKGLLAAMQERTGN